MKRNIVILIVVMLVFNSAIGFANEDILMDTASYLVKTVDNPQVDSIGGEWAVFALARLNYKVDDDYYNKYYNNLVETLKKCDGVLHDKKYTEYSRVILALNAIGKDANDVAGFNIVEKITDFEKTVWQGLNGAVYALLALDTENGDYKDIKQKYLEHIINNQNQDGGFSLSGGESDVDITAMALQALSKYKEQENVKNSIDKALTYLSNSQTDKGGFISFAGTTSQSVSQVILALCELGIDVNDSRFIKNNISLKDNLLNYYQKNNGFLFTLEGNGESLMATEQALMALVSMDRQKNKKPTIYNLKDVSIDFENKDEPPLNMNKDIKKMPFVLEKKFDDIKGHENEQAILELASREIINGKGEKLFDPNSEMTRAEFATIVVKSLGLPIKRISAFADVPYEEWFAPYVETAFSYQIINGISNDLFAPNDKITKEQAATMIARTAKLCGLSTDLGEEEIRNMLAQFDDYKSLEAWSENSVAFLYKENILSQDELEICPKKNILRCEIAQMLYNLLSNVHLL